MFKYHYNITIHSDLAYNSRSTAHAARNQSETPDDRGSNGVPPGDRGPGRVGRRRQLRA